MWNSLPPCRLFLIFYFCLCLFSAIWIMDYRTKRDSRIGYGKYWYFWSRRKMFYWIPGFSIIVLTKNSGRILNTQVYIINIWYLSVSHKTIYQKIILIFHRGVLPDLNSGNMALCTHGKLYIYKNVLFSRSIPFLGPYHEQ